MIAQVTPQGHRKMDTNDIRRSLRLLDYDSHEIRVIHPNRTSIPSQLIHSFAELLALCQKHDGLSNIYVGVNERNQSTLPNKIFRLSTL
mgnify:CR=1 FL=1